MQPFNRKLIPFLISTAFAASYTLGVQGNVIDLTPASPSVLAGQTVQLTANGAVAPAAIAVGAWHTCVLYIGSVDPVHRTEQPGPDRE